VTGEQQKVATAGYIRLIERSIDDGRFRELLETDPDAALQDLGLWVTDPDERAMVARRLAEGIKSPVAPGGEGCHVGVLVVVGVAIGTNLSAPEMEDPETYRREIRARVAEAVQEQGQG
jgi:hypothetical protein